MRRYSGPGNETATGVTHPAAAQFARTVSAHLPPKFGLRASLREAEAAIARRQRGPADSSRHLVAEVVGTVDVRL